MPATESNVDPVTGKRPYTKRKANNGSHWASTPAGKKRMSQIQLAYHARKKAEGLNGHVATNGTKADAIISTALQNGDEPDGRMGKADRRLTYKMTATMAAKYDEMDQLISSIGLAMVIAQMGGGQ